MGNHIGWSQSESSKAAVTEDGMTIQVKSMLTTAQKNFKNVPHPDSILTGRDRPTVTREDLSIPGAQCFLLRDILTQSECQHYIAETEKIGYSGLSDTFPTDYRSNDRVLSICEPLVQELWLRMEPLITRTEVIRVRPMGFGNEGTWKPFRLNECCKFGRYTCDGHFSPHIDGPWVPREDESSIFTVVVYLNTLDAASQGGTTRFLREEDPSKECGCVTPTAGSALIFNHDALHEGEPVKAGTKYIIRTEIMYRRVDTEMLPDPGAYQKEENYIKTLTLYQKSWELEQEGDVKGFTDTYLQAIQLQKQAQRSISMESCGSEVPLPHELYLRIFGYLTVRDLCNCMAVCKFWYDICMDGQLWYDLYRHKWPIGIKLEATIDPRKPTLKFVDERPFIRDWYGHYKQRAQQNLYQKVAVFDLGSFSIKCAALHREMSTIRKSSIQSVVATVPGVYHIHMRRFSYERYYCGQEAKEQFPGQTADIVKRGLVTNAMTLPEIVTGLFIDCRVRPKYTPVVILEPPGLWTEKMKGEIAYCFITRFENPRVSFLSTPVAVLCSLDLQCGVVVDIGHGLATCAVVWNRELKSSDHCGPREATPEQLAKMVEIVIQKFTSDSEVVSALKECVVLTGGKACNSELLLKELRKSDAKYAVRMTDDPLYSAVLGGCSVANLSSFKQLGEVELYLVDKDHITGFPREIDLRRLDLRNGYFYISGMLLWYRFLNGQQDRMWHFLRWEPIEEKEAWKQDVTDEKLYTSDKE